MIRPNPNIDNPYEIRDSTIHGRGLFAKRDIIAGEELPPEEPLWLMCNAEMLECYPFKRKTQRSSDDLILSMLRYMNDVGHQYGPPQRLQSLTSLLTMHNGFSSYDEARGLWERDGSAFVRKLSDIFIANAIGRTESGPMREEERFFCAVFATAARINHSCVPNFEVRARHENGDVTVRGHAIRNIKKDEEITRSYVSAVLPTADRQERLKLSWDIVCRCALCARRPDLRAASDGRRLKLREAHARIERCQVAVVEARQGTTTKTDWEKTRDELCDEILSDRNIGVVEDVLEREDDLSGLYFYESFHIALLAADLRRRVTLEKRYLDIMIEIQEVLQVIEPEAADRLYERRDRLEEETENVRKKVELAHES